MKIYRVNIAETLSRVVEVKAASEEEAVELVDEQYNGAQEIVLDADDFAGVEFEVIP